MDPNWYSGSGRWLFLKSMQLSLPETQKAALLLPALLKRNFLFDRHGRHVTSPHPQNLQGISKHAHK